MDPSRRKEVTFKIIFKVYDCRSGSKNEGICYVECNDSSFNLQSVESSNGGATALRVDIIRPGRYVQYAHAWCKLARLHIHFVHEINMNTLYYKNSSYNINGV